MVAKRKNQPIREAIKKAGASLKSREIDHIIPLADGGSNDPANLRVISKALHKAKTKAENTVRAAVKRRRK